MGWELRRSAPSDNVMVPATSDPFESPKWAPPVWHMPPALVLLANLVRGLLGVIGLAVRHPITVTVAAGLGWLTYVNGWQLLAFLAAVIVFGLCGWAAWSRHSFVRLLARLARARWRYLVIYRRNWRPVMVMSGLAFYRNAREYLPTIKRVEVTRTTDRVLVKMLSGQAPSIWEDHTANLAQRSGFSKLTRWVDVVRMMGAPGLHFHDLRHTGNTRAWTRSCGWLAPDATMTPRSPMARTANCPLIARWLETGSETIKAQVGIMFLTWALAV